MVFAGSVGGLYQFALVDTESPMEDREIRCTSLIRDWKK